MAKRKPKPKPKRAKSIHIREDKLKAMLREVTREAAHVGLVTAIEHTHNFWSVSDGYKKYIDYQVKSHAEELMAAVKTALREELVVVQTKHRKR